MMLVLVEKETGIKSQRKEMAQDQLIAFLWLLAADWSLLISFDLYIVCSAETDD